MLAPYLKIFCLCGQSCYLPVKTISFLTIIKTFPTIGWAIKGLLISIALATIVNFGPRPIGFDKSDVIITNIFITCEIAKTIAVAVQSLFFTYAIDDIIQTFSNLEDFFRHSLHYKIEYEQFRNIFLRKTVFLLVIFLLSLIPHFFAFINAQDDDMISFYIKIIRFETIIASIHVIFYIELLRFHMKHLNLTIERDTIEQNAMFNNDTVGFRKYGKEILLSTKYRNYKHVHFQLWNAMQKINHFFGWSLTTVFLQTFVDGVFNSYWLFITFNKESTLLNVSSEYTNKSVKSTINMLSI